MQLLANILGERAMVHLEETKTESSSSSSDIVSGDKGDTISSPSSSSMPDIDESAAPVSSSAFCCSPSLCTRLWPFFSHGMEDVRRAAALTLSSLLSTSSASPASGSIPLASSSAASSWISSNLVDAMRLVFQRSLLEDRQPVIDVLVKLWRQIVEGASIQGGFQAGEYVVIRERNQKPLCFTHPLFV